MNKAKRTTTFLSLPAFLLSAVIGTGYGGWAADPTRRAGVFAHDGKVATFCLGDNATPVKLDSYGRGNPHYLPTAELCERFGMPGIPADFLRSAPRDAQGQVVVTAKNFKKIDVPGGKPFYQLQLWLGNEMVSLIDGSKVFELLEEKRQDHGSRNAPFNLYLETGRNESGYMTVAVDVARSLGKEYAYKLDGVSLADHERRVILMPSSESKAYNQLLAQWKRVIGNDLQEIFEAKGRGGVDEWWQSAGQERMARWRSAVTSDSRGWVRTSQTSMSDRTP